MKRIILCLCLASFVAALSLEAAQGAWAPVKPHAQSVAKKKKKRHAPPKPKRKAAPKKRVPSSRA